MIWMVRIMLKPNERDEIIDRILNKPLIYIEEDGDEFVRFYEERNKIAVIAEVGVQWSKFKGDCVGFTPTSEQKKIFEIGKKYTIVTGDPVKIENVVFKGMFRFNNTVFKKLGYLSLVNIAVFKQRKHYILAEMVMIQDYERYK